MPAPGARAAPGFAEHREVAGEVDCYLERIVIVAAKLVVEPRKGLFADAAGLGLVTGNPT